MRGKVMRAVVAVLAVAGSASLTTAADAAEEVHCKIEIPGIVVDPGLSTEGNSGEYGSGAETGTIDCGPGRTGTIGADGRYGTNGPASCQSGGEGWGVFSVTLGDQRFKDTFTIKFASTSKGVLAGELSGTRISGRYTFTGTEGNCATAPITKGTAKFIDATLKS